MTARVYSSVPPGFEVPEELLQRAARVVLDTEGVEEGEFSIAVLPDEPIRGLNRRWLGHDWVPDVLAFALHEPGSTPVGDVYIGLEQAARQADEHRVPVEEEIARLTIHGTLHVLGYDHPK
ncbi:MAG: rRNA maturation RNase YbeY, partial [Gemmatimonadota bacterium]